MKDYSKEFIICTRDLTISKLSRLRRFGGTYSQYVDDDKKASEIFKSLMSKEKCFILSFETSVALGYAYYQILFKWLGINSEFSPDIFDANKPYIRNPILISLKKQISINKKKLIKLIMK